MGKSSQLPAISSGICCESYAYSSVEEYMFLHSYTKILFRIVFMHMLQEPPFDFFFIIPLFFCKGF